MIGFGRRFAAFLKSIADFRAKDFKIFIKLSENQKMKKIFPICFALLFCCALPTFAQIPVQTLVQISKAEDELRFDKTLEDLMKNPNAQIRARAALASGRTGKESAIFALTNLLEKDSDAKTRSAAAFALGEIESIKGADAILQALKNVNDVGEIRARAIEAAGKIAAALPPADKKKAEELGAAILNALDDEAVKPNGDNQTILLGITAILRARPENGEFIAAKFLTNADARIRADAANTLSRLRAKNANVVLRAMLFKDKDPIARANAARALGAAEDKDAFDLLVGTALNDEDSRVRVSSIRSLANLKDAGAADRLMTRAEMLLNDYKKSKFANLSEKNELLEIAATLGRILPNTNNERAVKFLSVFRQSDKSESPEIEIAYARISPIFYSSRSPYETFELNLLYEDGTILNWKSASSVAQGLGEIANIGVGEKELFRKQAEGSIRFLLEAIESKRFEAIKKSNVRGAMRSQVILSTQAIPDILRAYAQFKTADLPQILRDHLKHEDVIVRAAAVELMGDLPPEQINRNDFVDAFRIALEDEKLNDALLATIEALGKQKTEHATDFLKDRLYALSKLNPHYGTSKYLARRRIIALLKERGAGDFSDKLGTPVSIFRQADYVRAVSRKNARAVLTTGKGTFTIEFFPEAAPLTVENFIKLAKSKYFDGLTIHRVVPNFVVQDGDPRGDGNGGPGWEIRDEINTLAYERGTVGMALSGKDTGGSQWFVAHSPQPHLDGGYTVFGRVGETDMKIVDNLARGDKILSVKIVEGDLPQRTQRKQSKKN